MKLSSFLKLYGVLVLPILVYTAVDYALTPRVRTDGLSLTVHWPSFDDAVLHGLTRLAVNNPGLFVLEVLLVTGVLTTILALFLGD